MRFHALATDYDGTIAHTGRVDEATLAALRRLKDSGRALILVTGRELPDLLKAFPHPELFDRIVAENGALLYRPDKKTEEVLAPRPPPEFAERLRQRGVRNLSVGRVIIGTYEPYETIALEVIRELGLELQVIFNKGAVMVLPSGWNKAKGLRAALREMGLALHNVVGVGDAENDHAFLEQCGCAAVVENGLPALKEKADLVTTRDHGAGVAELIDRMIDDDLASVEGLRRHDLVLGTDMSGTEIRLPMHGSTVLIAGSSGGGKSTLTHSILERVVERRLQALVLDPEGDYIGIEGVLALGTPTQAPIIDEILNALQRSDQTVVANLVAIPLQDKPGFFRALLPRVLEMRSRLGRPHWLLIDETHHVLPASWLPPENFLPNRLENVLMVTVEPSHISKVALKSVDTVFGIGSAAGATLEDFARTVGHAAPQLSRAPLHQGQAYVWRIGEPAPRTFEYAPPKSVRRRHVRKYAKGELDDAHSFHFEGPEKKLRLRAQNLQMFVQLADGVDDGTWTFHLGRGDYSKWLRECVKDEELADVVEAIERRDGDSPEESRRAVRTEIEKRYTAAA